MPTLLVHSFLEARDFLKVFARPDIFLIEDLLLFHLGEVLDPDLAIHPAHDAGAFLLHSFREALDLLRGFQEEIVEALAEDAVKDSHYGENIGMIKGSAE